MTLKVSLAKVVGKVLQCVIEPRKLLRKPWPLAPQRTSIAPV